MRQWHHSGVCTLIALACAACSASHDREPRGVDGGWSADAPALSLLVSPLRLSVREGDAAELAIQLSARPPEGMVVTLTPDDSSRMETPASLTFDRESWSEAQPVRIIALHDGDAAHDVITLTISAPGVASVDVGVEVIDDDIMRIETIAILASADRLHITDGGEARLWVRLTGPPGREMRVAVAEIFDTERVQVSPSEILFSDANWAVEQDVVVTVARAYDPMPWRFIITLTGDAGGPSIWPMFTLVDDEVLNIDASPAAITALVEGGPPSDLDIRLTRPPARPVRISILPSASGAVSATPSFVDFSPGTWDVVQRVQLSALDDGDGDDEPLELQLNADDQVPGRRVPIWIYDDDHEPLSTPRPNWLCITEGTTVNFGVRFASDPGRPVSLMATPTDSGVAIIHGANTLIFDSSNYDVFQLISIFGVEDDGIALDQTLVRLEVGELATSTEVLVRVPDDD